MAPTGTFVVSLPLLRPQLYFPSVSLCRRSELNVIRLRRRANPISCCANSSRSPAATSSSLIERVRHASSTFVNLFPLWTVLASVTALRKPLLFSALTSSSVMQGFLSLLMLSTGLSLSPRDLVDACQKPLPVLFNFVVCFFVVPVVAVGLCGAFGLQGRVRAGLIFLAVISGGQASNLCTLIAGGDTALSVTMTTTTTLAATVMLPVVSSVFLGTVVAVDQLQMAITTARVTLAPIIIGAAANQLFPQIVSLIRPLLPVLGIVAVLVLVLGPVSQTAAVFSSAWSTLLVPVLLVHILGGAIGFAGPSLVRAGWKTSITTAFETAFKSPVLSYVLAKRLFPPGVELASAVSVVVLIPVASLFAVALKQVGRRRSVIEDGKSS